MIYVILPAWNEAEVIHPTLLALVYALHASGEAYHAVLVDDGSTDATIAEAERAVADSGGRLAEMARIADARVEAAPVTERGSA